MNDKAKLDELLEAARDVLNSGIQQPNDVVSSHESYPGDYEVRHVSMRRLAEAVRALTQEWLLDDYDSQDDYDEPEGHEDEDGRWVGEGPVRYD